MASMLTCEICLEKKTDRKPKCLNCLHSFCRECIVSWADKRQMGGQIECPVCRKKTNIPPRGIDGLIDDFKVHQLEEMMKTIGDPFICQGCLLKGQTSRARVKCETCDRRLCDPCYQFHSNHKISKNHHISTDLCAVHGNAVSYMCLTCSTGICTDCFLCGVHDDHDMYELDEGMGKLRETIKDKQKQFTGLRNKIKSKMTKAEVIIGQTIEINIVKLKRSADAMKQEIDRQVNEVIRRYRKQVIQERKASFDQFESQPLPGSLKEFEQKNVEKEDMSTMLDFNSDLSKKIRQVIDAEEHITKGSVKRDIKDILTEVGKPLSLLQFYDKENTSDSDIMLREILFREITGNPKLLWQKLSKDCAEIGIPLNLEIMDDFSAIVAFKDHDNVARFDESGQLVALYSGSGNTNSVTRFTRDDYGNIYMLCKDRNTVIHLQNGCFNRTIIHIQDTPDNIYSFTFNTYNDTFILSQVPPDGKVYLCKESDMLPEECSQAPGRIRVLPYAGSYRIVVSSVFSSTVMVYDEKETLLYTLTGCGEDDPFKSVGSVALLGQDTLLVPDPGNHRVCRFIFSGGSFDGSLLTKTDGIKCPSCLACRYPYICGWEAIGEGVGRRTDRLTFINCCNPSSLEFIDDPYIYSYVLVTFNVTYKLFINNESSKLKSLELIYIKIDGGTTELLSCNFPVATPQQCTFLLTQPGSGAACDMIFHI